MAKSNSGSKGFTWLTHLSHISLSSEEATAGLTQRNAVVGFYSPWLAEFAFIYHPGPHWAQPSTAISNQSNEATDLPINQYDGGIFSAEVPAAQRYCHV